MRTKGAANGAGVPQAMQRLRLKDGAPDEPDTGDWDAYASSSGAASAMLARISCFMTAPAGETIC